MEFSHEAAFPVKKAGDCHCVPATVALVVSGYLAYTTLTSSTVAGCSGSLFDCQSVLKSQWSRWFGVPVSVLAALTYVGLLGSLAATQTGSRQRRNTMWLAVSALSLSAGLAAIWFISLQVFVLNHLCAYCLTAHGCGLLLAMMILFKQPLGSKASAMPGLAAFGGLAVLVVGQALGPAPVTYKIETFEPQSVSTPVDATNSDVFGAPTENDGNLDGEFAPPTDDFIFEPPTDVGVSLNSAVPKKSSEGTHPLSFFFHPMVLTSVLTYQEPGQQESASNPAAVQPTEPQSTVPKEVVRLAKIQGGNIKLNVRQWPLCGSPDAKYVFVEMFDYSCPHCRNTHQNAIKYAQAQFGNDLAVVALPLPLNTNCNTAITQTGPKFIESCELAKLAVAVWRVDPAKFTEFHNWMFAGEPKTFMVAKAQAETLVDPAKLATEIDSKIVAGYIGKHVEIYNRIGRGEVPKLMFPNTSVVGEFNSGQGLINIIEKQGPLLPLN